MAEQDVLKAIDEAKHWVKDQLTYWIAQGPGKAALESIVEAKVDAALARAFGAGGAFYKGDGVYQRFAETTYEQVVKALEEGIPAEES